MEQIPWSVPEVGAEELAEITASFGANWLTMGPKVLAFENAMGNYLGVPYALAVSNGSIAIDLVLQIIGLKPGDEVIVPSMTYYATAASVSRLGGVPVFVDIEDESWNLNPALIEAAITERTKAILFIDYGGNPAAIDEIAEIGRRRGIEVLQDAAQSLGGVYKGRPLGGQTRISTMSFHMAKVMTTVEGGMIFTHDDEVARLVKIYRNQGESAKYLHSHLGTNARMSDMMAGIGLAQFAKLPRMLAERKRVAERYRRNFHGRNEIRIPECRRENSSHANFLFSVLVPKRDEAIAALKAQGIDTRICYPMPLARQELYAAGHAPFRAMPSPIAEKVTEGTIALPIYPSLRDDQIDHIADILLS